GLGLLRGQHHRPRHAQIRRQLYVWLGNVMGHKTICDKYGWKPVVFSFLGAAATVPFGGAGLFAGYIAGLTLAIVDEKGDRYFNITRRTRDSTYAGKVIRRTQAAFVAAGV